MKKNILLLLILSIVFSCSTKTKPTQRKRFLKGFQAYYNTLFNAEEALKEEIKNREESYKDNFFKDYIPVFTYQDEIHTLKETPKAIPQSNLDNTPPNVPNGGVQNNTQNNTQKAEPATILEIAQAKALKTIEKYSVIKNGLERNKIIFDAYLILVKSRILSGKYLEAIDALEQLYPKLQKEDKRLPLAKVYEGLAYSKLKDYKNANEVFESLKNRKLSKRAERLLYIYYGESLLYEGKKKKSGLLLLKAFQKNKNRKIKSRIAFLRGQILTSLGRKTEARESFQNAYKYANNFEFEVKSQIEIAKTYTNKNDYLSAKKYLEKLSKKGTYASRKNEFYYALGLMANKVGKKKEGQDFFFKALKEKVSDPQIRGLCYYEIGKDFFDKSDYITAGAYYDSALVSMTYEPMKVKLTQQTENIKKLSKNYYLIKKNDSILALTKMSQPQQEAYFQKFINKLKIKEEEERKAKLLAEKNKGFGDGDYNANSIFGTGNNSFQNFGNQSGKFYFSNTNTISKGVTEFQQIWGNRPLSDNWRYSKKQGSVEDLKNEALGLDTAPDPRRFETKFYIEKIPTDKKQIAQLKKDRDTASLGLGSMYFDLFENRPLATKTLYDLVDVKPEKKVMLLALYKIFSMNYEIEPQASARAKMILLRDYPYSSYAEFAKNPRSKNFVKSNPELIKAYKNAYQLYKNEKFEESLALLDQSIKAYPNDGMIPKLMLLKAFNTGKTAGKEVMILQLKQVALNYEDYEEGRKAKEMLQFLKTGVVPTEKKATSPKKLKPPKKKLLFQ